MKNSMKKIIAGVLACLSLVAFAPETAKAGEYKGSRNGLSWERSWPDFRNYQEELDVILEKEKNGEVIVIDSGIEDAALNKKFKITFNKKIGWTENGVNQYVEMHFEDKNGFASKEYISAYHRFNFLYVRPDSYDYIPDSRHYILFKKGLPTAGEEVLEKDVYVLFKTCKEEDMTEETILRRNY